MKTIYIKSTFSEIDELDGLYKVSIPQEYENNYQDIIENQLGNVLVVDTIDDLFDIAKILKACNWGDFAKSRSGFNLPPRS